MAKAKKVSDTIVYPVSQEMRSGCKVSWAYYADRADAEKCAEAAKHNARYYASKGYDFGYQSPGYEIRLMADHTGDWAKYNGLWEVCLP